METREYLQSHSSSDAGGLRAHDDLGVSRVRKEAWSAGLETLLRLNQERKELPPSEYKSLDALN